MASFSRKMEVAVDFVLILSIVISIALACIAMNGHEKTIRRLELENVRLRREVDLNSLENHLLRLQVASFNSGVTFVTLVYSDELNERFIGLGSSPEEAFGSINHEISIMSTPKPWKLYLFDGDGDIVKEQDLSVFELGAGDLVVAWYQEEVTSELGYAYSPKLGIPDNYYDEETGLAIAVRPIDGSPR